MIVFVNAANTQNDNQQKIGSKLFNELSQIFIPDVNALNQGWPAFYNKRATINFDQHAEGHIVLLPLAYCFTK